jgi:uncharacterized protein (DUF2252 family)
MARDVGPRKVSGILVQACGDAHLLNLGAYAAPDGHLVFDLNDFDESCRGPFEWDLWRLAASVAVAGRSAGVADAACGESVMRMTRAYRKGLARFAGLPVLELARLELTPRTTNRRLGSIFRRAARNTPQQVLARYTSPAAGGLARFRSLRPLLSPLPRRSASPLIAGLNDYRKSLGAGRRQIFDSYRAHDAAFRVAGTGSVGVQNHVVLLYGNGAGDLLLLQFKEEDESCWQPFVPRSAGLDAMPPHQGRRAAEAQLRTQTVADPFLGWARVGAKDVLVRQWSDHKASVSVDLLAERSALDEVATLCGTVLAKAHARTGDAGVLSGYCGTGGALDEALARFAMAYADQTEADHTALVRAIRRGQLPFKRI